MIPGLTRKQIVQHSLAWLKLKNKARQKEIAAQNLTDLHIACAANSGDKRLFEQLEKHLKAIANG